MKTPITRDGIRNHLTYSWWKYALVAVLAIFGWNLFYTMTAYQAPAEKRVNLFVFGTGDQTRMDTYMEAVRTEKMADMEDMSSVFLVVDEAYTPMQLMTYIAAGEGDLYVLPKDYFQSYAGQGAFMALEEIEGLTDLLDAAGVSYDRGWRTNTEVEPNEKHLYGIPMSVLPGFGQYAYAYDDSYISIVVTNGNDENCIEFLKLFLTDMLDANHQMPVTAE